MESTGPCKREGNGKCITGSKMRENGPQEELCSHDNSSSILKHGLQVASSLLDFTAHKNKFTYLFSFQQKLLLNGFPAHP